MPPRDSKSSGVTIRCKGTEAVHRLVAATRDFCERAALEAGVAARLAIIAEELVANLVEHGDVGEAGSVELELVRDGAAILLRLGDDGPPFDPRGVSPGEAIPERGGGAGLDLVRAWAEIVDYRSDRGWNRLELRMPLQSGSPLI